MHVFEFHRFVNFLILFNFTKSFERQNYPLHVSNDRWWRL